MKKSVVVIGHADADGHLITEQVRRNLAKVSSFDVKAVVDPERTKDHRAWTKLESLSEIEDADLVFFVDLMFAPDSFAEEAGALVDFVTHRPDKEFFLIDHHPLPTRRLASARNLHVSYRPEVFECAIGPRSGMMVVAALCEGQKKNVADVVNSVHTTLALGVRRAAAIGGPLPGEKLLALLRSDCWTSLFQLGSDDREYHRLPRGRRSPYQPQSDILTKLEKAADGMLSRAAHGKAATADLGRATMSYDVEISAERFEQESGHRVRVPPKAGAGRDLETIVTLLEVAALSLTTEPGQTFTRASLIAEARSIAGEEIHLEDTDIDIVLKKQSFLKRSGQELCLR